MDAHPPINLRWRMTLVRTPPSFERLLVEGGSLEWRKRAACRLMPADMFFPVGVTGIACDEVESAKAVCRSCIVAGECLDFALRTRQEFGVWGGADEEERRLILKSRRT